MHLELLTVLSLSNITEETADAMDKFQILIFHIKLNILKKKL